MQKIILSLALIIGAGAVIATGATGAFFSDSETSTGNTFAAGAIDLKVDNESYYNSNKCAVDTNDINNNENTTEYVWQGTSSFPVPGTTCTTSWLPADLGNGLLFFNFTDIKPDDEGEDTISLHVNNNDAYLCMDMSLTSNDDNSSTEPELAGTGDVPENINNTWDGELAQNIQMFWWADDGDNVYEANENSISGGVRTLYNLATSTPFSVALADSQNNAWNPNSPGPIPGDQTVYIAKAWCFGTLTPTPVPAGTGVNPSVNPGVTCDGTSLNNLTQTDGATLDIAFRTVQSRNNSSFVCNNERPRLAKIKVIKQIVNDNGGNNQVADYQLFVDNGVVTTPVTSGVETNVTPGSYTVIETGVPGYVASFSGDCNAVGNMTIADGESKTCTITNNDLPPNITLVKQVLGGSASPTVFGLSLDGNLVQNNTSVAVSSNAPHTINEAGRAGYHFTSITGVSSYGKSCPAILGGSITLDEGETVVCTITNTAN